MAMAAVIVLGLNTEALSAVHYIPSMSGQLYHAVVDGDWVAWMEQFQGTLCSVYAHHLGTDETGGVVVDDPTTPDVIEATASFWDFASWHAQIDISDSTIVFADRRNWWTTGQLQIRTHNLDTGVETVVSPSFGSQNDFPVIDGNRVVWQYGSWRLYAARTNGSGRQTLAYGQLLLGDVSGDIAIWRTVNGPGSNIVYRNLATGASGIAFRSTSDQDPRPPAIDGNIIAWSMRDLTTGENIVSIMAYDIATRELITVKDHTGSPEHRSMIAVSGDWVVWEDWRAGNEDIYAYNLSTHEEVAIATGPMRQLGPSISGDVVVWSEPEFGRIGWARLSESPEPSAMAVMVVGVTLCWARRRA